MTTLIVGASGATGRRLTEDLLNRGVYVKAIVRSPERLPEHLRNHKKLTLISASIVEIPDEEMAQYVDGCDAVASCLGHNLSLKGIYGQPRRLVTDTSRRLCDAIKRNNPEKKTKFVLMNTTGNRNRDLAEPISFMQKTVIGLIRLLLPPHADNEEAADYLRTKIGQNDKLIEWAAIRPDGLVDDEQISEYEIYPSPIRSAIFNAGKTSRINVGHFMADLITEKEIWEKWKGQMPVIYNKSN